MGKTLHTARTRGSLLLTFAPSREPWHVEAAKRHNTTSSGLDRYLCHRQNACDRAVLLNVAVLFGSLRSHTPTSATLGLIAVYLRQTVTPQRQVLRAMCRNGSKPAVKHTWRDPTAVEQCRGMHGWHPPQTDFSPMAASIRHRAGSRVTTSFSWHAIGDASVSSSSTSLLGSHRSVVQAALAQ